MATTYALVSASTRDEILGTNPNTAGAALAISDNNITASREEGYAYVSMSGVPVGATITAATVHWYGHSYSQTSRITPSRIIKISPNGGTNWTTIRNNTNTTFPSGWRSEALTSGELTQITGSVTDINFEVANPGASQFRTWQVRAWDYGTGSGISNNDDRYSAYMTIEYTEAPDAVTKVSLINTVI